MNDASAKAALDATLAQMLQPVRNVPFPHVIKAMSGHDIIRLERGHPLDDALVTALNEAIQLCGIELTQQPICRPRPNEVGNDVDPYVMRALSKVGLVALRPTSKAGLGQSTGYPDILLRQANGRHSYLECKIFNHDTPPTTMRSFYLSPSESFKVSYDARHLLLAFGMEATAIRGSRNSSYVPRSFKLVDLGCNVKYEFNSDNRSLYAPSMVILQGSM